MNYDDVMTQTIDYIEHHLYEHITLEMIADHVYLSVPQLYRIFSAYHCASIKKYIRQRRVSEGALKIKNSNQSILDIALSLGFDSHEVFIRAFKEMYGVSPSRIKKNTRIELIQPFDVAKHRKQIESEVKKLDVPIVMLEGLNLQVIQRKFNQKEQNENALIPKLIDHVEKLLKDHPYDKLYSLYEYDVEVLKEDDENINYMYFIGIEADKPFGEFKTLNIPKGKYATFTLNIEDMTLNGEKLSSFTLNGEPIDDVYDYIDGIWVVTSGYQLTGSMDLEVRDKNHPHLIKYFISIL